MGVVVWQPFPKLYKDDALLEEERFELIEGLYFINGKPETRLCAPYGEIFQQVDGFLAGKRCVLFLETDVKLSEDNIFRPDVMVVCDREKIDDDGVNGTPDLVVEVLSASTFMRDKTTQKDIYELCGVKITLARVVYR